MSNNPEKEMAERFMQLPQGERDAISAALARQSNVAAGSVTARGLYFDANQAMRDEYEEGAIINHIYEIVENAGKRDTEEGGEVQIYEAELAYLESGLRPPKTLPAT